MSLTIPIALFAISILVFGKLLKMCKIQRRETDEDTSSTSTPNSGAISTLAGKYEVFLSFCGKDTRKGFTDFLYTYLHDARIHTFRDYNELRVGENIGPKLLNAIKDSKICIPILSENYASSKWCLRELAQMVECHKTDGQMIFPIFYDVDLSDIRHQTGSYKKAFYKHKNNFDVTTVQGWKEALTTVGKLKGLELKKETDGYQGKLVKLVVEKILSKLKKNYTDVPDILVGVDHHVEKMWELLDVDSNDLRIVGIHGMGGIGKTTIAKVIYNKLCDHFESCSFLYDVRETSKCKALDNLEHQHRRKKALIVLDDVDEKSQFDKLVGKADWFGSGSKIIITTRNEGFLNDLAGTYRRKGLPELYRGYEPQVMNRDNSLQLFRKHAFETDLLSKDDDMLSEEVVKTAAGLPLVLVTTGSLLYGKDKCFWKETLKKLGKICHPLEEVMKSLRISFDALDVEQKEIFLDIACFFVGKDKENPFYMWADCKFCPIYNISVLILKSLVKVRDNNTLWMHDTLRDLGRQIVCEENLNQLGDRSRLWSCHEALEVLETYTGTNKVVALSLTSEAPPKCLNGKQFVQLPYLRFLNVGFSSLDGDFKHLLSKLRWLKWRNRNLGDIDPTNIHLKNLVILDLSGSEITDEWKFWSQIQMATKLKVLHLSNCLGLRKAPDFSTFASLERLILTDCEQLEEINQSIGDLINLRVLDFSRCFGLIRVRCSTFSAALESLNADRCKFLETLPDLSNSKSVKTLSFCWCKSLTEIQGLDKLESLECLDMTNCKSLERLPDLSNFGMLKELKLHGCIKLCEVEGLSVLESLVRLNLSFCTSLKRIPDLSNLKNIRRLSIDGLKDITEFQGLEELNLLDRLNIGNGKSIKKLSHFSNFKNLKFLEAFGCVKLTEIEGLEGLRSLEWLYIAGWDSMEILPDLSNLINLKTLKVEKCARLTEIGGLGMRSLLRLDITGCESIEKLPDLFNLRKLKKIRASDCVKLSMLPGLDELGSLEELDISGCKLIENLPDLSKFKNLKKLFVNGCVRLTELQGLDGLQYLDELNMTGCERIETLPDLSNLKKLRILKASDCVRLTEIRGLEGLESLFRLDVGGCKRIETLPDLSNLKKLRILIASNCVRLTEIRKLEGLESLYRLDLSGCVRITNLPDLSNLKKLEILSVDGCVGLTELQGLDGLQYLKELNMTGCERIETLPDLSNLKKLKMLIAFNCVRLTEIWGLEGLEFLDRLDVGGCKRIETLPDLSNLKKLRILKASECVRLTEIRGLEGLESLKWLDLSGCVPDLSNRGFRVLHLPY